MAAQIKKLTMRIAATGNIAKITKSMKMVAASKLRGDQFRLDEGRLFVDAIYRSVLAPEDRPDYTKPADDDELEAAFNFNTEGVENPLLVAMTSDRGLCGGVNSFVAKCVRGAVFEYEQEDTHANLITIGEKGRAALQRLYAKNFVVSIDENWKDPVNFDKVACMAERVLAMDYDYAYVFFNRFNNSISYTTTRLPLPVFKGAAEEGSDLAEDDAGLEGPKHLQYYESESGNRDDCMRNLHEFSMACIMYGAAIENAASEQSSRMTAMGNASDNATDMIGKLQLKCNRARQAAITTELIEIISGAAALDDA